MATPHVAGLAAILKQRHPAWTGEQLKSAIANSTVPVADATGFDAGTGRVDALTTIDQDVLAPASLSLGSYAWPYSDLAADPHDADLHQHRGHRRHAGAGADRRGRLAGADRLDVPADRPRHRPGQGHRLGRRHPRPDGRRPRRLLGRGHRHPGRRGRHRPHRPGVPPRARGVRRDRHHQAARRLPERLPPARPQRLRRAVGLRAALVRRRTRAPRARRSASRRATTRPAPSPSARPPTARRRAS